jgi:hypothetical protein
MRDAALGNFDTEGPGMGIRGTMAQSATSRVRFRSLAPRPRTNPTPSHDLSCNPYLFCQKARPIVVNYCSMGAFSCIKPCLSLDTLSSSPVFSCTSPEVPSFLTSLWLRPLVSDPSQRVVDPSRWEASPIDHRKSAVSCNLRRAVDRAQWWALWSRDSASRLRRAA